MFAVSLHCLSGGRRFPTNADVVQWVRCIAEREWWDLSRAVVES